jgi:CheY-like chemotaxis protein
MKEAIKTVLVVEDDFSIRETLREILEVHGYVVRTAENGREGLEKLKTIAKPCLVLLDMMMPVMDGRAFLDAVREDTMLAPIPVLVVSATATPENTRGAVDFMKKPPDLDLLLKMVDHYIQQC